MNPIQDLIDIAKMKGADITQLLYDAFNRGYNDGKNNAKSEAIKLLKEEL